MYCELQQVDLKVTKHIYITVFDDDDYYITTISAQFYANDYYFNYFIDALKEQLVFDYLINDNIASICKIIDKSQICFNTEKPENNLGFKMKLTSKALLNVL